MASSGRVVKLLKNHLYPTYQLYALMGNKKTKPQDGLRLGALTVTDWLRRRLGGGAPAELEQMPSPDQYREADSSCLVSLHMNHGFVIDIVSLPEEGAWSLQITEPDLGSDPGNPEQTRPPVPGRVIETNVGFFIHGTQLECGFQTVISDPDGTESEAEVYRLSFIRQLIRHPDFGLKQVRTLTHELEKVESAGQLNELVSLLRDADNQIPAVVFTCIRKEQAQAPAETLPAFPQAAAGNFSLTVPDKPLMPEKLSRQDLPVTDKLPMPPSKPAGPPKAVKAPKPVKPEPAVRWTAPPYDMETFAKYGVTCCRTFLLADSLLERFASQLKLTVSPGDVVILEPERFGGGRRVLPFRPNKTRQNETMETLRQEMYPYSKNKEVSFGHIAFLSAARESLLRNTEDLRRQSDEVSQEWTQKLALLEAQWKAELQEKDAAYHALTEQLERQRQYLARVEKERETLRAGHTAELARVRRTLADRDADIAYLKRKLSQPKAHNEIPAWAAANFSDRLLLHARAAALLEQKWTVDVGLICDALDFLATDYWDRRYLQISNEEMNSRCSEKYGRPFDVTHIGTTTIEFTPKQYKIKYFLGARGRPVESALDFHLRVGNDSESLLRIYFLHDDAKQLIVIGSLPGHLKSVTIQ